MSCLVALFPENAGGLFIFLPSDLLIYLSPHIFFHLYLAVKESFFKKLHVVFF